MLEIESKLVRLMDEVEPSDVDTLLPSDMEEKPSQFSCLQTLTNTGLLFQKFAWNIHNCDLDTHLRVESPLLNVSD